MTATIPTRPPYYQNMGTGADPEGPRPNYWMLSGLVVLVMVLIIGIAMGIAIVLRDYPQTFHLPATSFSDSARTPTPRF